jgi:hypothetical protein
MGDNPAAVGKDHMRQKPFLAFNETSGYNRGRKRDERSLGGQRFAPCYLEDLSMKMIGMLIVLGLVLALTYTMAQDMGYLSSGENDRTTIDAVGITGNVLDKVDASRQKVQKRLDSMK